MSLLSCRSVSLLSIFSRPRSSSLTRLNRLLKPKYAMESWVWFFFSLIDICLSLNWTNSSVCFWKIKMHAWFKCVLLKYILVFNQRCNLPCSSLMRMSTFWKHSPHGRQWGAWPYAPRAHMSHRSPPKPGKHWQRPFSLLHCGVLTLCDSHSHSFRNWNDWKFNVF